MEKREQEKGEADEDQDSYIRDVASVWGLLELVRDWLPHHRHNSDKIADYVLFPSAMYGQLQVLKLALPHGNLLKRSTDAKYPGWSLMHFAIEGAQRTLAEEGLNRNTNSSHERSTKVTNERHTVSTAPPMPKSEREVLHTQLDIIMELAEMGVPLAEVDDEGVTASYRACKLMDPTFLEGALLLDILSMLRPNRASEDTVPETPGLSNIPKAVNWKQAMENLVEWAYTRDHFRVLCYCQETKFVDLSSPKLLIHSNTHTLRQCLNPLMVDTIHREKYNTITTILSIASTPSNVLSRLYEYTHGMGQQKESVFSYACHAYLEGRTQVLTRLLSLPCSAKFLTRITVSGVNLRRLPFAILHENLTVLDARENHLDSFPDDGTSQYRLGWNCPKLTTLNFSKNLFSHIHPDIFSLPSLSKLVMSGNRIQDLPVEVWTSPLLSHLELNGNMIAKLPCPQAQPWSADPMTSFLCASSHARGSSLQSWRDGYISHDVHSAGDLHRSQIGFGLQFLDVSENRLSDVPKGLPCLAPLLQTLRLSNNAITNLGTFADYPALLQSLDVSHNGVTRGVQPSPADADVVDIECLQSQLMEAGHVLRCTHYHHRNFSALKFLYLCGNRIQDLQIEHQMPGDAGAAEDNSQTTSEEDAAASLLPPSERDPPGLLYPKLQALKISDNALVRFPVNVHRLTRLRELVVSGNEAITQIPDKLHQLTSLFTFRFDGIRDPIVEELARFKNTAEILYHLKARELRCCRNTSMRLFLIGHFAKGKTTLLKFLTGSSANSTFDTRIRSASIPRARSSSENVSTVGIECGQWECTPKKSQAASRINFYTWDYAGQEEYYVTHQCFLTNRALYLLVWNVLDGDPGIDSLSVWLQNLQARAKGSPHTVIVVGTHLDQVPRNERERRCSIWRDKLEVYRLGRNNSRNFPSIARILFVGCPPKSRGGINIEVLNDMIYETAVSMDSPRSSDNVLSIIGFKMKVLEEKIPTSYEQLRRFVEALPSRQEPTEHPPAIKRKDFCEMVAHIIEGDAEVETAVNFLHATTGVILHFNLPIIKEYFIVNPQRWFDLCALVIAPNNVSSLVRFGRPGDEKLGLLQSTKMNTEFRQNGCSESMSRLIQSFLNQLGIIHQVNKEYSLVPSAINSEPMLHHHETLGSFPKQQTYQAVQSLESMDPLEAVGALVARQQPGGVLGIKQTGLIYRRMLLLPPIGSGFWSKLITLCLQKQDFQLIVLGGIPQEYCEWSAQPSGPAHRLRTMIGNLELSWMYWKTGIVLFVNETAILELHSLYGDQFQDPCNIMEDKAFSIFESRIKKAKNFVYESPEGWKFVPSHFKDRIEITVPEMMITVEGVSASNNGNSNYQHQHSSSNNASPMSSKILVKALEIVDEVLKSQCEQFATAGIYSHHDMMQVIPCPIDYGDRDERYHGGSEASLGNLTNPLDSVLFHHHHHHDDDDVAPPVAEEAPVVKLPHDCLCVFTVEAVVKASFTSDSIVCPKCGPLELEALAPDLLFSDVSEFKVDKNQLDQPVSKEVPSIARGSFGIVFRRVLYSQNDGALDVAVKLFDQDNAFPLGQVEPMRSYSDMRYELNKLCSLQHPHIVGFLGVITNPHCFVLEWAPMMSLEKQRVEHCAANISICTTAIFYVLLQVTSALSYLHSPHDVGIVHRDLKSNNILVFRFPPVGHTCFPGGQEVGDCRVLVKITDMGISTNPAAADANSEGGLRIYVPEALANDGGGLTEKVDIFTLGSCLYEMMTLRPLPPSDIGEPHYKQILLSGKRPQFYPKDTAYPPLLFQILEDCWQQEYYLRPSAQHLYSAISELSQLNIANNHAPSTDRRSVLLDSFTLHQEQRVSCCQCYDGMSVGLGVCAAVGEEITSTAIVSAQYRPADGKNEVKYMYIGSIKNTGVISLQVTPTLDIFIACSDGTICYYDDKRDVSSLNDDSPCNGNHGSIVKVHYCPRSELLVFAFENGKIHIQKRTLGLKRCLAWRESCSSLYDSTRELLDMECLLQSSSELECQVFEVWIGVNCGKVEVWRMPIAQNQVWTGDTVSKIRTISHVSVSEAESCEVRQVEKSKDESMMAAMVYDDTRHSVEVVIIRVASKQKLVTLNCKHSVSSLLLTSRLLAIGLYDGSINLYQTPLLLTQREVKPKVLHAHMNKVYSLHYLQGHVDSDGYTSIFPTFVGRACGRMERDFLVSVGHGRGYPTLKSKKVFKKSSSNKGSYVNIWIV